MAQDYVFLAMMVIAPLCAIFKSMYEDKLKTDAALATLKYALPRSWKEYQPDSCDKFGIYSKSAADRDGAAYYQSLSKPGQEVLVTTVGWDLAHYEDHYLWPDRKIVGCVGEYIRPEHVKFRNGHPVD